MPDLQTHNEPLNAKEKKRYEICTQAVLEALEKQFDAGIALIEIRDQKLYREEFDTFDNYCDSVLKITRQRAYQLIEATEVKEGLPAKAAAQITNESQARVLSSVPEEHRAQVVAEASKEGKVTAAGLKAAAEKMSTIVDTDQTIESGKSKTVKQKEPDLDQTGYPIPEQILEIWNLTNKELKEYTQQISKVRSGIRKIMEESGDNPVWRKVSVNSVMVALDNAYREISGGIPYCVCPYCQGKVSNNCDGCKQTGFLGRFDAHAVPKELMQIRERLCKKAAA